MDVRRDLRISMGVMIALPLLLAANAIILSTRMGPAIDRVIDDNVVSIRAAAEVVELVAEAQGEPLDAAARERTDAAYERIRANLTEEREPPLLAAMEASREPAFAGDPKAVRDQVTDALALIDVNIDAMHQRNAEARRLGSANAWAALFAGLFAFVLSRVIARRLRLRIIEPIADLWGVLRGARSGEVYRRCRDFDTSEELGEILRAVNDLLDHSFIGAPELASRSSERASLLALLERLRAPACVVSVRGTLVAANERLHEALAGDRGDALRQLLRAPEGDDPRIAERVELRHGAGWLVVLDAPPDTQQDDPQDDPTRVDTPPKTAATTSAP
ncbi:MAG: hypothetical protein R3A79_26235 [Nannocystaceae bacterium]